VLADRFQLDSFGFPVEKLEAAGRASPHRKVHGQISRCFAGSVGERVTLRGRVDALCPAPRTGSILFDDWLMTSR
jgi:hypothetical protein